MPRSIKIYSTFLLLIILSSFTVSYSAHSQEFIYAVDGAQNNPASLHIFDRATGAFIQTIGPTGFTHVTGIAFHPVTGILYGVISDNDNSGVQALITIDVNTGAGTMIGPTGMQIPDITFRSDGTLFGWCESDNTGQSCDDDLITIDLITGAATKVAESGIGTAVTGLAFDSGDNLYLKSLNVLYFLDANTGLSTGSIGLSQYTANVLAFDLNDTLYSACNLVARNCEENQLLIINPDTGEVNELATHPLDYLSAIAFMPLQPEPPVVATTIPTLSEWGLITMAGTLGLVGFMVIRKRRLTA